MVRFSLFVAALLALSGMVLFAEDDGPPISITSPDTGTTFAYGTLKSRTLLWDKHEHMLIAQVSFTDAEQNLSTPTDDTHQFRLPGVSFDATKGTFSATTAKGEVIPVAHIKKMLFIKSIEMLPNARVRVIHVNGSVTVILEAISPNNPAMRPGPSNPDGEHKVDIDNVLN